MKQDEVMDMTWEELKEFVKQMSDGTSVIVVVEGDGDERDEISNAVKAGDYITALRGADEFEEHKAEITSLKNMREDYALVCSQFGTAGKDGKLFERYLSHEFDLLTIADTEGVSLDAIKQRFRRVRKIIILGAVRWIHRSEEYYVLQKGA